MITKEKLAFGTGRVWFFAHLQEIKDLVGAGWPVITIFEKYKSTIPVSYSQLAIYIKEHIKLPAEKLALAREQEEKEGAGAEDEMLDLCDNLIDVFLRREEELPPRYGRLAGLIRGFVVSMRKD